MSSPARRSRAATTVRRTPWVLFALLAALLSSTGCSGDEASEDDSSDTSTSAADSTGGESDGDGAAPATPIILNGQGNHLDAWSIEGSETASQRVVTSAAADPEDGIDINAQIDATFLIVTHDRYGFIRRQQVIVSGNPTPGSLVLIQRIVLMSLECRAVLSTVKKLLPCAITIYQQHNGKADGQETDL